MTDLENALTAENATLRKALGELQEKYDHLLQVAANLSQRVSELQDMVRRRRTKDRPANDDPPRPSPDGASSDGGGGAQSGAAPTPGPKPKGAKRKKGGRRPISSAVETDTEHHTPPCCARCGHAGMFARDTEVSNKYTFVGPHVRRRRIVRDVRTCVQCNHTTTAPMPPMPWERSQFTCELVAWVVYMKFVMLVPLDRLRRSWLRQGVDIPMSTLVYLIERASDLLAPIDGHHWKELLRGPYIATDGTHLKTLIPFLPNTWLAILDIFCRDHLHVYTYSLTKHGDVLANKLEGYAGIVLSDAESRIDGIFKGGTRIEANCNAHPRRKFRDAEKAQPELAAQAGAFMQEMYRVEEDARNQGLVGEQLLARRQTLTRPIVDRFHAWLVEILARADLLQSDPFRKVAAYTHRHFKALTLFVDDPSLPIDNNRSERGFQNHAKLRLNSLFAGSPEGGHRWAILMGVVTTALRLGVDVFRYLVWAMERQGTHRKQFGMSAADLTPEAYKKQLDAKRAASMAA